MAPGARRFVLVFMPVVLAVAVLTVTHVNSMVLPTPTMLSLRLLPMTGFAALMVGVVVAALALAIMRERLRARTLLIWGLIGTMLVAYLVSNLYREPLLRTVATRAGTDMAATVASEREYERIEFTPAMLGHINLFALPGDEHLLRTVFYEAYLGEFAGRYADMADNNQQSREGYRCGSEAGLDVGRVAAMNNARMQDNPTDEAMLVTLRESELPVFVKAFERGYRDGWQRGYGQAQARRYDSDDSNDSNGSDESNG